MNLGIAQSFLGHHRESIRTFQAMIKEGVGDSFLVDFNLAREYAVLGDKLKSQIHRTSYLQKFDESLKKNIR